MIGQGGSERVDVRQFAKLATKTWGMAETVALQAANTSLTAGTSPLNSYVIQASGEYPWIHIKA